MKPIKLRLLRDSYQDREMFQGEVIEPIDEGQCLEAAAPILPDPGTRKRASQTWLYPRRGPDAVAIYFEDDFDRISGPIE